MITEYEYTAVNKVKGEMTVVAKVTEESTYGPTEQLYVVSRPLGTEYFVTFDTDTGHRLQFAVVPKDGKTYTVLTKHEG